MFAIQKREKISNRCSGICEFDLRWKLVQNCQTFALQVSKPRGIICDQIILNQHSRTILSSLEQGANQKQMENLSRFELLRLKCPNCDRKVDRTLTNSNFPTNYLVYWRECNKCSPWFCMHFVAASVMSLSELHCESLKFRFDEGKQTFSFTKSKTFTRIRHIWRKYFSNSGFDDIHLDIDF